MNYHYVLDNFVFKILLFIILTLRDCIIQRVRASVQHNTIIVPLLNPSCCRVIEYAVPKGVSVTNCTKSNTSGSKLDFVVPY